ncbi:MAG: acyl-[acyl-carrier-protein] thioesterase [Pseudobutyrivibrio sp.]|jgi:acyl-ACP thioesterase|uniref:acyl-[acyl-carrier-protein] thioesterase n=1 Tax=Pseudobutyrivibrio sp. TaxID=2014367 RepID=UPI0025E0EFD4|nr:acyl-ACP thioesterase domain-containing protein [Pseudobutyrivibrio sp.]MBE5903850.1 acyl-[acyl-carrier-protein] thioesterase [Pseudobutyrivibrio sp.]
MYQYSDRISYSEVDANLNLTYYNLVNYMQDCSCFHSDDVGVGVHYLAPLNLGWFVTTYEIHINRLPKYMERIKISTYPYQVRGMMARRVYVIESEEDGELLIYADSLWVLMNLESLHPARLNDKILEAYPLDDAKPDFKFDRSKLQYRDEGELVGKFKVNENHIDTNGHMNNSFYIDVTRRYLPKEEFSQITVNYKKAALLFDELDVYLVELEKGYQVVLKKDDEVYTIVEYK